MSNNFPTLETSDLETVTGGKQVKTGASSSSSTDIQSALTGIQSSLKDLSKPQQSSSAFGGTNLMLFAMLAMNRPAAQTNVVYVQRRGSW